MWYGVSSIAARFLNYLLTPYITAILFTAEYGEMSYVYALIPFANVIFTYGLETAYFRYVQRPETRNEVYGTITISLIASTLLFSALMLLFRGSIAELISVRQHPEYITWATFIIAFDALSTIAFARLRQEGRPLKYAHFGGGIFGGGPPTQHDPIQGFIDHASQSRHYQRQGVRHDFAPQSRVELPAKAKELAV